MKSIWCTRLHNKCSKYSYSDMVAVKLLRHLDNSDRAAAAAATDGQTVVVVVVVVISNVHGHFICTDCCCSVGRKSTGRL